MERNSVMPARFVGLKSQIAESYPDFETRATRAWNEVLQDLEGTSKEIVAKGQDIIPQVNFAEITSLKPEVIASIKRRGCVVIKDVVDDAEAAEWKASLAAFVKENPTAPGIPADDKQFFFLYWTKEQVLARSHPNVLAASAWMNQFYHVRSGESLDGVELNTPLTYADRFRIRHPGVQWDAHPPHVDGGGIERWEDESFRSVFGDILSGDWRKHDPYELAGRINARTSLYGRPGQATIFRTFQGWLALSESGPQMGTIRFFPDVLLSNAYTILRPFFRRKHGSTDPFDPSSWEYDISTPEFPGIVKELGGYKGPRPTTESHPHFRLEETMTSIPRVNPGDMVFWHCDTVHSVESEHNGKDDSAVMYIPAVPKTPQNWEYVARQRDTFAKGVTPPDFEKTPDEVAYKGVGRPEDVVGRAGRLAMGFEIEVA